MIFHSPWVALEENTDTGECTIETVERGTDLPSQGYYIAHASSGCAQLIAAAPELLEALLLCECELSLNSPWANSQAVQDALAAARKAIAKAKGKEGI